MSCCSHTCVLVANHPQGAEAVYQCPLCRLPLALSSAGSSQSWQCPQRHTFDVAKEGYVNLLPVQRKNSTAPGDNAAMISARRAFLSAGYYAPLAERLSVLVQQCLAEQSAVGSSTPRLLDIGAGEGYYTAVLAEWNPALAVYGFDISKVAVKAAAKSYRSINWCVASAYDLPYAAASFDLMTRIYAPSADAEITRCLAPHGRLFTVTPAPHHLAELKGAIYSEPAPHSDAIASYPGLTHQQRERLTLTLSLTSSADMDHLLAMTPLGWKLTAVQQQEVVSRLTGQPITADFYIDSFSRDAQSLPA